MVNVEIQGKVYAPTAPYLVGREKVREFARAVLSEAALHHDPSLATSVLEEALETDGGLVQASSAAGVTDATIKVNADAPVPIPPGGTTNLSPPLGTLKAPTIVFTNVAGYGYETVD